MRERLGHVVVVLSVFEIHNLLLYDVWMMLLFYVFFCGSVIFAMNY